MCSGSRSTHAGLKEVLGEIAPCTSKRGRRWPRRWPAFRGVFGEMAISMVRAGGEGGFLEEALARVAEFTETQDDLKKRTIGAMAYPVFLAVVGTRSWSSC